MDWPMAGMAGLYTIGNLTFIFYDVYESTPGRTLHWFASLWPYMLLGPAYPLILGALKQKRVYSFAHTLFFVCALIPMLPHTAKASLHVWRELNHNLDTSFTTLNTAMQISFCAPRCHRHVTAMSPRCHRDVIAMSPPSTRRCKPPSVRRALPSPPLCDPTCSHAITSTNCDATCGHALAPRPSGSIGPIGYIGDVVSILPAHIGDARRARRQGCASFRCSASLG